MDQEPQNVAHGAVADEANQPVDETRIAALRAEVASLVDGRPHDHIKALVALAEALPPGEEKVELFLQAADLYTNTFKNQAEAVRAYEAVLALDPTNAVAIDFLRQSYGNRRDWEKLIALMKLEAEQLGGEAQLAVHKEVAQLASDRIKKPPVCIELWSVVLEADPDDVDALRALSQLYERDRQYEQFADVLERLIAFTAEPEERTKLLLKLGQVTGDRLKDDARAAEAYRLLLELEPDDRRYQEQLKKRYLSLGKWDELELFYAQTERWDEFIRVLESNESRAETDEQRIGMLMKVAELWMTQKGKPDRAARAYEKVLTIEPEHLGAAERLIPIYTAAENPKGLVGALETKLQHVDSVFEQVELLRQAAELYGEQLNDPQLAFERLLLAFELVPDDPAAQEDAERSARAVGGFEPLVASLEEALKTVDAGTATRLHLQLGRLLEEELGKSKAALEHYQAVAEVEPDNELALAAMERLYASSGNPEQLLEVYERRLQLEPDPVARRQTLLAMAKLYERALNRPDEAIATYHSVLEEAPDDADTLAALDGLLQRLGDMPQLADVLARRIELETTEEGLTELKYRLARVEELDLGRPDAALAHYREVLLINQEHVGARQALEGMLTGPLREEAASMLQNIYEVSEDWASLVKVLEIAVKGSRDANEQATLLRRVALTYATQLGDPQLAFEAQARALSADPGDETAREEAENFARLSDKWSQLATLYSEIADAVDDGFLRRDYLLRLAALQSEHGEVDEAAASYTRVLDANPGDAEALAALEQLFRGAERWSELVGVYKRRQELAGTPEEAESLQREMAEILVTKLNAPDQAIAVYKEILDTQPSAAASKALDALFESQGRWADLVENLESRLELQVDAHDRVELTLRIAKLREERLDDVHGAVDGYRQVVEVDPTNAVALRALERLGESAEDPLLIAEILEPLYREQGDYQKLIGVYELQERKETDPESKVALLQQIASLQEDALADAAAAFATYARALGIEPTNAGTLDALERLADLTGRHEELASLYQKLGSEAKDPELGGQLYMLAADMVENSLRDPQQAIALYRKVLSIDPLSLVAVESLQRLFQASNRFDETSLVLQQKAGILDDLDEQKAALYQAATIEQDVLQQPDKAVAVYHRVLELDPDDLRSIDALVELHLRLEQWPALLEAQSKKADLVSEPEDKRVILYQMGSVYERELNDSAKAIDTYQRVLELEPDDLQALGRLDALYTSSENYKELLSVLTRESELTANADEAISYQFRIAEVYESHLGDVPRAIEMYRDILAIQPMHGPTIARLEAIKDGKVAPLAAALVLEPAYEASLEHDKLARVLAVQVACAEDTHERVELLTRLAALYEESVGDSGKAFETLSSAVHAEPANDEILADFERLAKGLGRWQELAEVYEAKLVEADGEDAVGLGMRVAQVYEVQLDQPERAIPRYRAVLEAEPENPAALVALDRLYTQTGDHKALIEILRTRAELGGASEEALEHKFRMGRVFEVELKDVTAAIAAYGEILDAHPEHQDARAALEGLFAEPDYQLAAAKVLGPIYQSAGEWEKLNDVHLAELDHLEDPAERLSVFYRLAQDTEDQLLDPSGAFTVYAAALAEVPLDVRTGEELERLAGIVDDGWTEAASTYADVVSQEDVSAEVQAELGVRLARVYEEELSDPDKATESYRFVLSVSPGEPRALDNLDRIYSSLEEWPELAEVLELRANVADGDDERVELLCRLGDVYEEHLLQLDDAERVFRRIFDDLDGKEPRAIEALSRIFQKKEAWPDLARVYERQLELAQGDAEEAEVRAKIARLSWDKLGKLEEAAEGWRRVIELRGEDGEALTGLADIYEHQERWAELSEVLERHYDLAASDEERAFALSRRAQLFSKYLGRDEEAMETWRRVLDIDYANAPALRAIAEIWRKRDEPRELVGALHALLDQAGEQLEPGELVSVYRELADVYATKLEQPFEASDALNHLLEVDATDLRAMDDAEGIYRNEENWSEVVRIKMLRADALAEPAEQVRELLEVTELWKSQIENYDGAASAFARLLEIEPTHEHAFTELEKLHRAASRWEPLIEVYLARLEHVDDVAGRCELWRRVARVFEEKLEDNEQAFVALDQSFRENFYEESTANYLGRMAHATGRWKELIASTQKMLGEQEDKKARIQLCLTLGKWYGEDLGMTEYAEECYGQVVTLDPSNVRVRRQMASSARLRGENAKAREILEQAEKAAVKNEDRKLVYVDLGDLLRKQMGDLENGVAYYKRALGIDPQLVAALDALEGIYEERGEYAELADVLRRKIAALTDADALTDARLRLGELYEQKLGELERAAEAYAAVAAADSTNLTALRGLERTYRELERWGDLVEVLETQLHAVQSERDRVELLLKIAAVKEKEFLKFDEAAYRFAQAVELDTTRLEAHEGLARCYRRLKRWGDLVAALERHLDEVSGSGERIALYAQIGQVYAEELENTESAIEAYQQIVDLDSANVAALDALAKLYDEAGDVHESIACLTRVAELTSDGATRVDMFYRIGKASLERLQDTVTAKERFETALELEPTHRPTLAALRQILSEEHDFEGVARTLEQEQAATETPKARARLLVELGRLRESQLSDSEGAVEAFRSAIEADPECEDAALPLLDHFVAEELWEEAEPLAELLTRKAKGKDRSEQHQLGNLLGRVYEHLGKYPEALSAYQSAFQLDVTSQTSIRGIASVSYQLEDWPTSLTNYQKVLTSLSEDDADERTEVYYRLGCIKRAQGQNKQAVNNFEKALALNGEHRPTLDALVSVHESMRDWSQVAEYKRQILDSVFDEDERYQLLLEIGDVWSGDGDNVHKSIEALEEAQELRPTAHVLLHRLLQLYQRAEEWSKMVDTIQAISDLEDAPEKKARYSYTMAQLYRDKLTDGDRAVELFNEALDLDPTFLEAFERINKVLTASRNWKQLERNYRKMIHRIAGKSKPDLEHELWYQLGLVYRDRIGDDDRAVDAFKMASTAKPQDLKDRQILAELYERTGRYDEAIAEQRFLLAQDPLRIEPYRSLYHLYLRKRAYDEAWCAVSAIAFMRKADEQEQRFYEDHRPQGMLRVQGRLSNEHWVRHLFHPDQNIYVSKILEGVAGAALKAKIALLGAQAKAPDKKFKEDAFKSTITLARTFGWSSQVLGLPLPDLYLRNDVEGGLTALPLEPRASQAGRGVLSGFQNHELAFICGKHLALYRPELYIRTLFPAQAELMVMFFAGVAIAAPNTPIPDEIASNVRSAAQALVPYLDAQAVEYLRTVVKRFMQDGAKANIKEWNRAAEKTTCRAAYLLCGSLDVARKIIGSETGSPELSPADKMKDLLLFTLSEEYANLRRALGVTIQVEE